MAYQGNYAEIPDWYPDPTLTMEPGNDTLKEWGVGYKPPAQWRNWQDEGWFLALKAIDQALAGHEAKKGNTHNLAANEYIVKTSNPNQLSRKEEIVGLSHDNTYHTKDFATEAEAQSKVDTHESKTQNVHGVGNNDVASKEWVMQNAVSIVFDMIHPVGDVVIRYDSANPSSLPGWKGTWVRIAENRMLIGQGSDPDFNAIGETGGAKTHTLTENEMPAHTHPYVDDSPSGFLDYLLHRSGNDEGSRYDKTTGATGGDQPHNNMPPYVVVYIWRRIP